MNKIIAPITIKNVAIPTPIPTTTENVTTQVCQFRIHLINKKQKSMKLKFVVSLCIYFEKKVHLKMKEILHKQTNKQTKGLSI
jgi:hypothetical protein